MAFDSLYTGITGLNAYQSWIDLISNNIANVDTVGFKGQSMTFADLFYQTQQYATGPSNTTGGVNPQQIGVGVQIGSVDTSYAQGGLQSTGVNTNLAINGDGFFILNNLQGSASPTYTRDGNFSLNSNGVLFQQSSGLAVQGWEANSDGVVTPGGTPGTITIPVGLQEQATATGSGVKVGPNAQDDVFDVALGGNLDQTQWQQAFLNTIGASAQNAAPYTISTTVYDSLGNAHQATLTYIPVATGSQPATSTTAGAANATLVTVGLAANQNDTIKIVSNGPGSGTYTITDSLGTLQTVGAGSMVTIDSTAITLASPATGAGLTETIKVTAASNGLPSGVANASGTMETPATAWKVECSFTDGTVFQTISKAGTVNGNGTISAPTYGSGSSGTLGFVYFDQNGQFINSSAIDGATVPGTSYAIGVNAANQGYLHTNGVNAAVSQGNQLDVTLWGQSAGNAAQAPTGVASPGAIGLDFAGDATQGGMASLSGAYSANVLSQNGYAAGTLSNISIGEDGVITGSFTNGQQKTLAQVAMASFANEDGLIRDGGNQFSASPDSGLARIGVAGTGNFGSIQSGALEQSNVSLANEFTNLIVAQRAFEANTRGITTADQNLQTVINLRASEN